MQDSPTRICIMSVNSLIESFSLSVAKTASQDITLKIDPILGEGIDVKNKFPEHGGDDDDEGPVNDNKKGEDKDEGLTQLKKFL